MLFSKPRNRWVWLAARCKAAVFLAVAAQTVRNKPVCLVVAVLLSRQRTLNRLMNYKLSNKVVFRVLVRKLRHNKTMVVCLEAVALVRLMRSQ